MTSAYVGLVERLRFLTGNRGLCAAIYTQTTDVEVEVNGLMTYDRAQLKMDAEAVTRANRSVYAPSPRVISVLPTAQESRAEWRFTTSTPPPNWAAPSFDAGAWRTGAAGFGRNGTPGARIGTEWATSDIWLRRDITLPDQAFQDLHLVLHHDEDAEVFFNGVPAGTFSGYTSDYEIVPLSAAARAALKPGANVIAIHCRQTGGGQYIDLGLVDVAPPR